MFRSGFRKCVQRFLPYSKKALPFRESVNIKANPDFITFPRTISFFNKENFESLRKAAISVSPAGRKRGRGKEKARQILLNPNIGKQIGIGKIRINWPGLTDSYFTKAKDSPKGPLDPSVINSIPEEQSTKEKLSDRSKFLKKKIVPVHDLERGWAGRTLCGKKLTPSEVIGSDDYKGFTVIPLELRFRNVMTSVWGKRKKCSAFVGVGNGQGALGIALAHGPEMRVALARATRTALLKLNHYKMENTYTVNHDFYYSFGKVKVFGYRRPEGFGLVCHRIISACCTLIGLKSLYAKVEGSRNPRYITKAFLLGLVGQKSYQEIANESGYHVVEFRMDQMNFPKLLASPVQGAHKEHSEKVFQEYVMGNLPLLRKKEPNVCRQYELHFKKTHYRRNMDDVRLRMLAKHGRLISHLTDIYPECETK